ncbi:MAG TPA: DUF11 domain-containing protein [Candidatus Nanoperiomorbaceae bacterium]|nr:DUF11 domain-containing protein [Candidatus Nanoperiomorbaceae bacterium]
MDKNVNNQFPTVGSNVVFTIDVVNQGPSTATGVVVTDLLPSGFTFVSSNGNYNAATGAWNIGTLAAGQSVSLQITATVNPTGNYLNLAEVTSANEEDVDSTPDNGVDTDGDGLVQDDSGDEDDGDGIQVAPQEIIDLELDKSVNNPTPNVGDMITFTLTLTNQGPNDATNVEVTDLLPSGYTYFHSNSGFYNPATGVWFVGPLAAGQTVQLQIQATVNPTGNYLNLAEVTTADQDDIDSTPDNGVDTDNDGDVIDDNGDEDDGDGEEVMPNPIIDLELEKSVDNDEVSAGEEITFTIEVTNNGPSTATGVVVSDELPSGYTYVSSNGNYNAATGEWNIGTLAAGQSVSLNITVTVNETGDYLNLAEVTNANEDDVDSTPDNGVDTDGDGDSTDDPGDEDDGDGAEISIICQIDLEVTDIVCDDNGTPADPSDDTYTFNLIATGSGNTGDFEIRIEDDIIPGTFEYGVPVPLGPYAIANGAIYVQVQDGELEACRDIVEVQPPATCSDICEIDLTASNIICDDNGTPGDPTDDVFYFDVYVNGNANTSISWTSYIDGVAIWTQRGYDRTEPYGPFPISGGAVTVVVIDDVNADCTESITVQAPESCSDDCGIQVEVINTVCNNNGTPTDPSDDTFTATLNIIGNNAGNGGWIASNGSAGAYGLVTNFGPFPIGNGANVTVIFTDALDNDCSTVIALTPPTTCSNTCDFAATAVNIECDDNGTPTEPADDTYTFDLIVTSINNTSGTWTDQNGNTGTYGVAESYGPFQIGTPTTLILQDALNANCTEVITVSSPPSCSNVCDITANVVSSPICNDNGTPTNPDDDYYTFQVQVVGNNTSSTGWTASNGISGVYGQTVTFGPYQPGASVYVVVSDNTDANCQAPVNVQIPSGSCSDVCQISAQVTSVLCDDMGTGFDGSDDEWYFVVYIDGSNTSGSWTASNGQEGSFDDYEVFGPYSFGQSFVTLTFADSEDASCSATVTAFAPEETCSDDCEMEAEIINIQCSDNGTPTDDSDDTYTFQVVVTGTNVGVLGWRQVINGTLGTTHYPYNTPVQFGPYPIAGGDVTIQMVDALDNSCGDMATAIAPAPCSDGCELIPSVYHIVCDDNGTPADPSDDTYAFEFVVNGANTAGTTWVANISSVGTISGTYGVPVTVQGISIVNTGDVQITYIADATDPTCSTDQPLTVLAPATCSNDCSLVAQAINVTCDDNGTPFDPSDDTYGFQLLVNGINTGGNLWMAMIPGVGMVSGSYNVPFSVSGIPIASGDLEISFIVDVVNQDCGIAESVFAVAPAPCSAPEADLELDKSVNNSTPIIGEQVTFTVTLSNAGPSTATGVVVTDQLPSGYQYVSHNASIGTYNPANGQWNVGSLAANASTSLQIVVVVNEDGNYVNEAEVTAVNEDDPDSTPDNDVDTDGDGDCSDDNGDEDDGDCEEVTPEQPCSVQVSLGNIVCNDNGTPFDPSDDTFSFVLNVNGQNTSGSWVATTSIGTLTGNYGANTFGPYPIAGGNITITRVEDANDPTCGLNLNLPVTAPAPCSDNPEADLELDKSVNNNTPQVGEQITFTVTLTNNGPAVATGVVVTDQLPSGYTYVSSNGNYNPSTGQWNVGTVGVNQTLTLEINVVVNASGSYTNYAEVTAANEDDPDSTPDNDVDTDGDGDCSDDNGDEDDGDCTEVTPQIPCAISVTYLGHICDDNGTPGNQMDDTFTFTAIVNNSGAGTGWTAFDGTTGAYGVETTFGPYPASDIGATFSLTFVDNNDPNCQTDLVIDIPNCTNDCDLTPSIQNVICNDNGTPDDSSDDTFTFDLTVHGNFVGDTWSSTNGYVGEFGVAQTFGPFLIADGDITFTVYPDANPTCVLAVYVTAPQSCSNACGLVADIINVECNDNGTPYFADDDYFTFDANVTIDAASTFWLATIGAGVPVIGNYGVPMTFGPFPMNGGDITINFDALGVDNCDITVVVPVPDPCFLVPQADLELDKTVNDNMPTVGEQITFTVTLSNSGPVAATGVVVTDQLPSGYTYVNSSTTTGTYNPNTGAWTVGTVGVNETETLTITVIVNATGTYTNYAEVTAANEEDPDSTPDNGVDTDGDGDCSDDSGDEDDGDCIEVTPQAPCQIQVGLGDIVCDDNDTPNDPSDDTYSFTLIVNGINPVSNSWVATTSIGTLTGAYGPITFGPYSIADVGNIIITRVEDAADATCGLNLNLTVAAPQPCSDEPQADLELNKSVSNSTPMVGEQITFTVTLTNDGPVAATGVVVTDQLPSGYTLVSADASTGTYNPATGDWTVGTIAANDTETLILTVTVNATGEYTNYAEVTASNEDDPDSTPDNGVDTDGDGDCSDDNGDEDDGDCVEVTPQMPGDLFVDCPVSNHYCPIIGEDIMLFSTDPFDCSATILVPFPEVTSECSDTWTVLTEVVRYDTIGNTVIEVILATIEHDDPRLITGIELGDYFFRYTVMDGCGNIVVRECRFRVADLSEPVAICNGAINISVGGFGLARLYAHQVDNGSYDNCGIDSILVRRVYTRDPMTCDTLLQPYYSDWGPYVDFTCCDAGLYVTVELRVVDVNGMENTCWLNVLVEDKTLPYCYGLEDVTVGCGDLPADFDPYNLTHLRNQFGWVTVFDNCSADAIELDPIVDWDGCGSGSIIRRFLAIDQVGNVSMAEFHQVIVINDVEAYDIRFPADAVVMCDSIIADTAIVYYYGCDSITVSHRDSILSPIDDECYRIERTIDVVNWCRYDGVADPFIISRDEDCNGIEGEAPVWVLYRMDSTFVDADSLQYNLWPLAGTKDTLCDDTTNPDGYWRAISNPATVGFWRYTQILTVYDTVAPRITFMEPAPFCSFDTINCTGTIEYPFEVFEPCSADSLTFNVLLDANADGTIDLDVTDSVEIIGTYPNFAIVGDFPIGTHALRLLTSDNCDNVAVDSLPFEVVDCLVAEPIVFDGLIVELVPLPAGVDADNDGDYDIAATQIHVNYLIADELFDCSGLVEYSINRVGEMPDASRTTLMLTCDDPEVVDVEIYAWDQANNPYAIQPDGAIGGRNRRAAQTEVVINNKDYCELAVQGDGNDQATPILEQNRPNPFNRETVIRFWLPEDGQVDLTIRDITGKAAKNFGGFYKAGYHEVHLSREDLTSYGIFYYTLTTDTFTTTKQMLVVE